jgi:hypothetical protein
MTYSKSNLEKYAKYLKNIALLSKLFSESNIPYLHYRTMEYLFCRIFGADNLSRSDITIDARLGSTGVGVKTFTYKGNRTEQKIAEFNKKLLTYNVKSPLEKAKAVSRLRNDRIVFAHKLHNLKDSVYHCIGRSKGKIFVFEVPMEL